MVTFSTNKFSIDANVNEPYWSFETQLRFANKIDIQRLNSDEGTSAYLNISRINQEKNDSFVIAFKTNTYVDSQLHFLVIDETEIIFIGMGELLLIVDFTKKRIIEEKYCLAGFWYFQKHNDLIISFEELNFSIFNSNGLLLWEMNIEPPTNFKIIGNIIDFDICGKTQKRNILNGQLSYL